VNLNNVLNVMLDLTRVAGPQRNVILTERYNFPTDLYIANSIARAREVELRRVDSDAILAQLDGRVAVLMLTHVNYRDGRTHDMAAINRAVHAAGALVVWYLSHSAGSVPVELNGNGDADEAAGLCRGLRLRTECGQARSVRLGAPAALRRWMRWASASRSPAGLVTRRRSTSRRATGLPTVSRVSCAARRRSSPWLRWNAASTRFGSGSAGRHRCVARKVAGPDRTFICTRRRSLCRPGSRAATPREQRPARRQISYARNGASQSCRRSSREASLRDFRAPDILRFGVAPLGHAIRRRLGRRGNPVPGSGQGATAVSAARGGDLRPEGGQGKRAPQPKPP
jgi:kynureninase